jgi:battenin
MSTKMTNKYPDDDSITVREYNTILQACYQTGVFISRSSLPVIKIKQVWVLSFLQAINFGWLFYNSYYFNVETLYVMCPLYVFVGLMGGGAYVNVNYGIRRLKTVTKDEKEMAFSLSLLFNDTGIFLASVFSLVMQSTILHVDKNN